MSCVGGRICPLSSRFGSFLVARFLYGHIQSARKTKIGTQICTYRLTEGVKKSGTYLDVFQCLVHNMPVDRQASSTISLKRLCSNAYNAIQAPMIATDNAYKQYNDCFTPIKIPSVYLYYMNQLNAS